MRRTVDARCLSRCAVVILAVGGGAVGGFISGLLTRPASAQAQSPSPLRATALELVDRSGKRIGFIGTDENGNIGLSFFDAQSKKRAEFGLVKGQAPRLDINGPDGASLLSLDLGEHAKPRLMMSDHDFNGRVYLGVAEPDAPDPAWKYDAWVLRFRGDHGQPLATIGMATRGAGGVVIFDQAGHQWRTPLKQ